MTRACGRRPQESSFTGSVSARPDRLECQRGSHRTVRPNRRTGWFFALRIEAEKEHGHVMFDRNDFLFGPASCWAYPRRIVHQEPSVPLMVSSLAKCTRLTFIVFQRVIRCLLRQRPSHISAHSLLCALRRQAYDLPVLKRSRSTRRRFRVVNYQLGATSCEVMYRRSCGIKRIWRISIRRTQAILCLECVFGGWLCHLVQVPHFVQRPISIARPSSPNAWKRTMSAGCCDEAGTPCRPKIHVDKNIFRVLQKFRTHGGLLRRFCAGGHYAANWLLRRAFVPRA